MKESSIAVGVCYCVVNLSFYELPRMFVNSIIEKGDQSVSSKSAYSKKFVISVMSVILVMS